MNHKKSSKNKAFTLIELMVATTLFTIIMLMGVGSLVTSSNSSKSAQRLRTAVDNVNFAMESIARELRTGTSYLCGSDSVDMSAEAKGDCSDGGNAIAFNPQQTGSSPVSRIAYVVKNKKIERCEVDRYHCTPVVSGDVDIENIRFIVSGSSLLDEIQPSVRVFIKGVVNASENPMPFTLQTMASQRSSEK